MAVIKHATFETDTDEHNPWYGCEVVRDDADAQTGSWSLLVTTTSGNGSGVSLDNWPGYSGVVAGQDYDCFLYYINTEIMGQIAWNIQWYDSGGSVIRTDTVYLPMQFSFARIGNTFTAPADVSSVRWTFTWGASTGQAFRIDNLLVQGVVAAGAEVALAGTGSTATRVSAVSTSVGRSLTGSTLAVIAAFGSLTVSTSVSLTGAAETASDAMGAMSGTRTLTAAVGASSELLGGITRVRALNGGTESATGLVADLYRLRNHTAALPVVSSALGEMITDTQSQSVLGVVLDLAVTQEAIDTLITKVVFDVGLTPATPVMDVALARQAPPDLAVHPVTVDAVIQYIGDMNLGMARSDTLDATTERPS